MSKQTESEKNSILKKLQGIFARDTEELRILAVEKLAAFDVDVARQAIARHRCDYNFLQIPELIALAKAIETPPEAPLSANEKLQAAISAFEKQRAADAMERGRLEAERARNLGIVERLKCDGRLRELVIQAINGETKEVLRRIWTKQMGDPRSPTFIHAIANLANSRPTIREMAASAA